MTDPVIHDALGLTLPVPDGWEAELAPNGIAATAPDVGDDLLPPPGLAVTLEPLDHALDPRALAEQALLAEVEWLTDLRLIDEEEATVAGLAAWRTLVAYRQGLSSITVEQWHAAAPGHVLVVAGLGSTHDYPVLRGIWSDAAAGLEWRGA